MAGPVLPSVRSSPLAALAGALLLAGAGCHRQAAPAPVGGIVVLATELSPALAEVGLDGRDRLLAARDGLKGAGFALDEGARRSYRATLEVVAFSQSGSRGERPAQVEVVVELSLDPSWTSGPVLRHVGRGRAPLAGGAPRTAWKEALRAAVSESAGALALDLRAAQKTDAALLEDLSAADPRERERAIRTLASRGTRGAAAAVARRIHDPDEGVARAVIDALIAFKDPASALSLIEAAQAGDASRTLRLLPVLAEIGGPDAEGYLLALRYGHGDRIVREAAAEAMGKLHGAEPSPTTKR